jgi:alpha-mannosidase
MFKFICFVLLFLFTAAKINVHIVPHTHDDVGWLFTMDQYYYGQNNMNKCVKCILDSMIISLENNPERTYTYVEMAFFEKWYKNDLNESKRRKVRDFVTSGRLEFINAGWVMNDEATPYYQDLIDNMRMGLHFLKVEFGVIPKVAWYIDPFGHSMTNVFN